MRSPSNRCAEGTAPVAVHQTGSFRPGRRVWHKRGGYPSGKGLLQRLVFACKAPELIYITPALMSSDNLSISGALELMYGSPKLSYGAPIRIDEGLVCIYGARVFIYGASKCIESIHKPTGN